LYSLSVAHMNDFVEPDGFVEASSGMLMVFAVGAVIGPMIASWATGFAGVNLLFPYIAAVYAVFAVFVMVRMRARSAPHPDDRPDFVATPGTSPALAILDPRSDGETLAENDAPIAAGQTSAPNGSDPDPTEHRGMVSRPPQEQA